MLRYVSFMLKFVRSLCWKPFERVLLLPKSLGCEKPTL